MQPDTNADTFTAPDETVMGTVHLRVANLDRSLAFYRDLLGYQVEQPRPEIARLVSDQGQPPYIVLHEEPGAKAVPRWSTGLFHVAILLPNRLDFARVAGHLIQQRHPFGSSDHAVSEALYLSDPDDNGLEIYVDRPRSQWPYRGDELGMGTEPLNFESLLEELQSHPGQWEGMPSASTVGHVHLKASDLDRAEAFYVDLLGFSPTVRSYPGALFVSAGGYHHHLGFNTWSSRGGSPSGPEYAGLMSFTIVLPDRPSLDRLIERLERERVELQSADGGARGGAVGITDMDGNQVVLACH